MHNEPAADTSQPPSRPLVGLLIAQFLGAFNDNIYKMVLSLLAVYMAASSTAGSSVLSLIGAIFILPFLLGSGYAGRLADVHSKRQVFVIAKVGEIVAMALGLAAFLIGDLALMLVVLFLMALQSTFLSPAKYGLLPELLPASELSRANGLLEMTTFLAIILGTTAGSALFALWQSHLWAIGVVLIGIAMAGTMASLAIPPVPASGAHTAFHANPWHEIIQGLKRLKSDQPLWLVAIGIAYFWFLGALLQMNLVLLGKEVLRLNELWVGWLQTFLALGIGAGSFMAGRLSGDKVEVGLVPLGALGLAGGALWLAAAATSFPQVIAALLCLGCAGGFFIVPLNAFLQYKSGAEEKGRLLATTNFLSTLGILLASACLWLGQAVLGLSPTQMLTFVGLGTLAATVYVLRLLPAFLLRLLLWLATHSLYRIRVIGREHVPLRGPALLVCNHLSFVDGFLVGACVPRFIRFMVYRGYYEHTWLRWLFRLMPAIPIAGGDRDSVTAAIARAREELQQGHVVCIFAEGAISRTGNLLPFKRGFERIAQDLDIPIIPVHLDRVWGSIFSFKDGKFLWKWPRRLPYPVTVSFGTPQPASITAAALRQVIMELATAAFAHRRSATDLLHWRFIATARRHWRRLYMADASGIVLTYGQALVRGLVMARWLRRQYAQETMIGLLLPPSVSAAVANIAVFLAGKIPINIPPTASSMALHALVQQGHLRVLVTSADMARSLPSVPDLILMDVAELWRQCTPRQHVLTWLYAWVLPTRLLKRGTTPHGQTPDALATIIFIAENDAVLKGVMLSHHTILSTIESIAQVFTITPEDRLLSNLEFCHALGFTMTLWLPGMEGCGVLYHHASQGVVAFADLAQRYHATASLSTPAFYDLCVRQCPAAALATQRFAIAAIDGVSTALRQTFQSHFGLDLLEGYGYTEMAPVMAVNTPDIVQGTQRQSGQKPGTVGQPLPGIAVKVVHPETGHPLPAGTAGLLLVRGPSRMLGYFEQPQRTAAVLRDGWFVTGDLASIDSDGFLQLVGHLAPVGAPTNNPESFPAAAMLGKRGEQTSSTTP